MSRRCLVRAPRARCLVPLLTPCVSPLVLLQQAVPLQQSSVAVAEALAEARTRLQLMKSGAAAAGGRGGRGGKGSRGGRGGRTGRVGFNLSDVLPTVAPTASAPSAAALTAASPAVAAVAPIATGTAVDWRDGEPTAPTAAAVGGATHVGKRDGGEQSSDASESAGEVWVNGGAAKKQNADGGAPAARRTPSVVVKAAKQSLDDLEFEKEVLAEMRAAMEIARREGRSVHTRPHRLTRRAPP